MQFRELVTYIYAFRGTKYGSILGQKWQKKVFFHTSHLLPTQLSLKINFLTALTYYLNKLLNKLNNKFLNNLCNLCYFCCSKTCFFLIVEFFCDKYRLPCSQQNILISLISQALIGLYLIDTMRPLFLPEREGLSQGYLFQGGCSFHINLKLKSEILNEKKKFIK